MLDLFAFIFLNIIGVMSPGPDFAMVTSYGLTGSRKAALRASCGIAAALIIHVFYCVSGIAIFLSASPKILVAIRLLGALYLGYLGWKILQVKEETQSLSSSDLSKGAFRAGFMTNLMNPKAMFFLLSLFSRFATSMNTLAMKWAFAISIPLIALSWFSSLAYFLTHPTFLPFMQKHRRKFMIVMGTILLLISASGLVSLMV